MDLYSYCNGDPVNNLDPDGRASFFGTMMPASSGQSTAAARAGGLYAAYGIMGTPSAVLANTRVQGTLKVVGGVGEVGIGGLGLATTSPIVVGAAVSGAAVVHGLDSIQSGVRQVWTNTSTPSATANGITSLTGDPQLGAMGDVVLGVGLSLGSGLLTQGGRFGGRVTQFFDPALGSFGPGADVALSSPVTRGGQLLDGASVAQTWVAPSAAQDMNGLQRMLTGRGNLTNYVEFDAAASELSNPGGTKLMFSPWQQTMSGDVSLLGRDPVWGQLAPNYGQYGFLGQLGSTAGLQLGNSSGRKGFSFCGN
jgi:hypothetical protein